MNVPYASAGSQRWLQVAVDCAPDLLLHALREVGALGSDETVAWKSVGFNEAIEFTSMIDDKDKQSFVAFLQNEKFSFRKNLMVHQYSAQ